MIPPRITVSKGVVVGYEERNLRSLVSIPPDEVIRHAIVVGATGSGKTTTTATLSIGLSKYGDVIIIDWFGEYRGIITKNKELIRYLGNIRYLVPGINSKIPLPNDPDYLSTILDEVLELSAPQSYLLSKVLRNYQGNYVSLSEIVELLEGLDIEAKWMIESKYALLRKLEPLLGKNIFELVSNDEYFTNLKDSRNNFIIIDLSKMKNQLSKKLATLSILKVIEQRRLNVPQLRRKRLYVVIEEVHNLLGTNRELLERLVSEIRKLNVGLILVTQSPNILGYRIITNANLRIVHSIKYRDDIDIMCRNLSYLKGCYDVLPRLKVGEAVIDASFLSAPLIINVIEPIKLIDYIL